MKTSGIRLSILVSILLFFATLTHATAVGSVSGSTVTLTSGKVDGVQMGMTALVYGIATVEGKAAEVPIAKVEVTAVNDRSCTAKVLRALTTATALRVTEGQKVVFQQELVPPSGKRPAESNEAKPPPPPSHTRDPYAGLSPLELSEKADAAYTAGRFDEAEKLYSAVLRVVPDDPTASKRLGEISRRKQQAESEERERAEKADRLKNADYFLTRGDGAYKAGDFAMAASYYLKVSEVDETYRDSGAKYWLSKALSAKGKGDTTALREARAKLKDITIPEYLMTDLAGLGREAGSESESASPQSGKRTSSPSSLWVNIVTKARFRIHRFYIDGNEVWNWNTETSTAPPSTFQLQPGPHTLDLRVWSNTSSQPIGAEHWDFIAVSGRTHVLDCNVTIFGNIKSQWLVP